MTPCATAAFHQAVTIQHRMDGALGGNLDAGESAQQALADFTSTPAGMLVLDVENVVLHLKGELMGIAIGATAPIRQPLDPTFVITIEYLIPGFAGDPELPAQFRHGLTGQPASHKFKPFVHHRTLLPRHPLLPEKKGKSVTHVSGTKCYPCVGPVKRIAKVRYNCQKHQIKR